LIAIAAVKHVLAAVLGSVSSLAERSLRLCSPPSPLSSECSLLC
jgi:hypothetical protein